MINVYIFATLMVIEVSWIEFRFEPTHFDGVNHLVACTNS